MDKKLEFSMHQDKTTHFHQDGAPWLNAKVVTQLFTERPNIKLIKWPDISPELNPLEIVWGLDEVAVEGHFLHQHERVEEQL
jgi:hypothetical protein